MTIYKEFNNKYQVTKTLVNELVPIGRTMDNIKQSNLLDVDFKMAADFLSVKSFMDDFHRDYIDQRLKVGLGGDGRLVFEDVAVKAFVLYQAYVEDLSNKEAYTAFCKYKTKLRSMVAKVFKKHKALSGASFITDVLPVWMQQLNYNASDIEKVLSFSKFTSYFTNFNDMRQRLYSPDELSISIASRIIDVNMELYFQNCINYRTLHDVTKFKGCKEIASGLELDVFCPKDFFGFSWQSNINLYNAILNGVNHKDGSRTKGMNNVLHEMKKSDPDMVAKPFVKLKKQLLSFAPSLSYSVDYYESDADVLGAVNHLIEVVNGSDKILDNLASTFLGIKNERTNAVRLMLKGLKYISNSAFGDFNFINDVLDACELELGQTIGLNQLDALIAAQADGLGRTKYKDIYDSLKTKLPVQAWLMSSFSKNRKRLDAAIACVKPLLKEKVLNKNRRLPGSLGDDDKGGKGFHQIQLLKDVLDSIKAFVQDYRPLHLVYNKKPLTDVTTSLFYLDFSQYYSQLDVLMYVEYNKIRNYLTKEHKKETKVQLNFGNYQLLSGWSSSQVRVSSSVIFEREGKYYLGIINQINKGLLDYTLKFDEYLDAEKAKKKVELFNTIKCSDGSGYNLMNYTMVSDFSRMGPKVFLSAMNRREFFNPSDEILAIANTSSFTLSGKPKAGFDKAPFDIDDCHKMIDYFKQCLERHPVWNKFLFKLSDTKNYTNISEFYKDVEQSCYKISFDCIDKDFVENAVENGQLYLFQIYNKDFSPRSKGKDSLNTIYFKSIFSPENIKDTIVKLNGGANMFFRKASIAKDQQIIHKANKPIKNKNLNSKRKSATYAYDIVKDKRFTQDKFFLHLSITLNYPFASDSFYFNRDFNHFLRSKKDKVNILALKRGESNLLYYVVLDQMGNIIDYSSLDSLLGANNTMVDYQRLLKDKELIRDKSRKSWASIDNIANLKTGFMSAVIHKIARLLVQHNAVLCVDGVDKNFRNTRQKIESNIYDKFIISLAKKLNYLVFKENEPLCAGGSMNALQLTGKFKSAQLLGKQSGALFIINPSYTTSVCPDTGFVNLMRFKYKNMVKAKKYLNHLDSFLWDEKNTSYAFSFDYKDIYPKRDFKSYKTKWKVNTHGDCRWFYNKIEGEMQSINVTSELDGLFEQFNINKKDSDMLEEILQVNSARFYDKFFFLLNLVLKVRHSNRAKNEDFLLSPILNINGVYYDSRFKHERLPVSPDASGAYHVGLKGLWALRQVLNCDDEQKSDLFLDSETYFEFIMNFAKNCKPWS